MALIHWIIVALPWLSTVVCQVDPEQNATVFAIEYGYPILPFVTLGEFVYNATGNLTNTFKHNPLATANYTDIVRPNADTMYSSAIIDLSVSDLVLTVPHTPDNYNVISFYDLYGNNFANLGTLTNTAPGQYTLVRHCDTDSQSSFARTSFTRAQEVMARPSHRHESGDDGIVFPTTYGVLTLRILVNNSPDDEKKVAAIQKQFNLAAVDRTNQCAPPLTIKTLTSGIDGSFSERILQLTARLASYNPPEVESDVAWVNATLQTAGIVNNVYTKPKNVDLKLAEREANDTVFASYYKPGVREYFGYQWSAFTTEYSGDFKSHYDVRALIAYQGYLQLQTYEAVYPIYNEKLRTDFAYNFTFYGKPPVNGFWSLTVYNSAGYLVGNPLNRYSLGDRSHLIYPNGTLVYGSNDTNGIFHILLQAEDIKPPNEWLTNWLPTPKHVPKDPQQFFVNLRWYGPKDEIFDDYTYPLVKEIIPIKP